MRRKFRKRKKLAGLKVPSREEILSRIRALREGYMRKEEEERRRAGKVRREYPCI